MFLNEEIKSLEFSGKHVNGIAKDVLLDFSQHSNIIKGSTGIGGTHSILNSRNGIALSFHPTLE